ncbi:DedA family protein [Candidatus Williamhamiltonella defendens]|uniref:DedA family protein n=1 Tax=Candidatus Williamhamiltonella defendens TaxID=138072 RepID=UPI0002DDE79C|nr:DedA family protein [Candidatus Hamiltonella defensa]
MDIIRKLLNALWEQDYATLADPSLAWAIYILLFLILFLENGVLPAAFLPGDSLLILVGVLIAREAMNFPVTLIVLTIASSSGSWVGYLQGRWLGNTKTIQGWLAHLPVHYHERAHQLFHRHGLSALLIGRFLAFIRTLLPTLAGISGLNNSRFQLFNVLSGLLWVLILTSLGFTLGKTNIFLKYEDELMLLLILLPVVLLVVGLISSVYFFWQKRESIKKRK